MGRRLPEFLQRGPSLRSPETAATKAGTNRACPLGCGLLSHSVVVGVSDGTQRGFSVFALKPVCIEDAVK